jgi:hypothetical protein
MSSQLVKYSHKILKDKSLILETLSGDFTINSLKTNRDMLYSDRFYNQHYDLLHDIRDARMNFTLEEHLSYLHYLGNEIKVITSRKVAVLTSESTLAKYEEWFDSFNGLYDIEFKVFSSLEHSLNWLGQHFSETEIDLELNKLKTAANSQCFTEPNAFTGF